MRGSLAGRLILNEDKRLAVPVFRIGHRKEIYG